MGKTAEIMGFRTTPINQRAAVTTWISRTQISKMADGLRRNTRNLLRGCVSLERNGFKYKTTSAQELAPRLGLMHRNSSQSFREERSSMSFPSLTNFLWRRKKVDEEKMELMGLYKVDYLTWKIQMFRNKANKSRKTRSTLTNLKLLSMIMMQKILMKMSFSSTRRHLTKIKDSLTRLRSYLKTTGQKWFSNIPFNHPHWRQNYERKR